jgi:hypothetical protein
MLVDDKHACTICFEHLVQNSSLIPICAHACNECVCIRFKHVYPTSNTVAFSILRKKKLKKKVYVIMSIIGLKWKVRRILITTLSPPRVY